MNLVRNSYVSMEQLTDTYLSGRSPVKKEVGQDYVSFQDALLQAQGKEEIGVSFSKHANERLESRNIHLSQNQMDRLNQGVLQAKQKSIKESLVVMDNMAFIVNVKNNTVITAMDQDSNDSNVFTNIDGAVIV